MRKEIINSCINQARLFAKREVPIFWDLEESGEYKDWYLYEGLRIFLDRNLTEVELTVLALSRRFGFINLLTEAQLGEIRKYLWSEADSCKLGFEWDELADRLENFLQQSQ